MYCSNCNQEVDDVEYCPHCEEKVNGQGSSSSKEEKTESTEQTQANQEENRNEYTWKTNVAVFFLWWAIVFAFYGTFLLLADQQSGVLLIGLVIASALFVYKSRIREDGISYGGTGRKVFKAFLIAAFFFAGLWLFTTGSTSVHRQVDETTRVGEMGSSMNHGTDTMVEQKESNDPGSVGLTRGEQQRIRGTFRETRDELNERLPAGLRTNGIAVDNDSITYSYVYATQESIDSEVKSMIRNGEFRRFVKEGVCGNAQLRDLADRNVSVNYRYSDPSGELLNEFSVQPSNCPQ